MEKVGLVLIEIIFILLLHKIKCSLDLIIPYIPSMIFRLAPECQLQSFYHVYILILRVSEKTDKTCLLQVQTENK